MPDAVTDTHALIWYLQDDARLSPVAGQHFDDCEHDGGRIRVPSICVVEIVYLSEKGRIPTDTLDRLLEDLGAPDTVLEVVELNMPIVLELRNVSRAAVSDMPDRIIAATALYLKLPLISRDGEIQLSGLTIIW
ncbi:MAG: type II toxin-antitoxin system VapC family toxin [Candidatus Tectomicrobia bacterium]|uniref:Type II toxin-antitoxin system VapC family toxin n=1 Tax=Tectimicrobiota bacterium TaxID=2528274 RepID=A0A932FYQ6_UNCTE|nr:type II toxin-antitoxin system VapC family toxin [Candidatus Tectomicrobia bacterium]